MAAEGIAVGCGVSVGLGASVSSGVAVAGEDGKFVWAKAEIRGAVLRVGNTIVNPVRIRYAWADNPDANLTSEVGLPVAPFEITVDR